MRFGKKSRKQRSSALVLLDDKKLQAVLGGAILGLIAAVVIAFVWRGKLRSAPGDDQADSLGSAETDDPSATSAPKPPVMQP